MINLPSAAAVIKPENTPTSTSTSIPISTSISITDSRPFQPQQQLQQPHPDLTAVSAGEDVEMFSNNESPKLVSIEMNGESSNQGRMN